MNANELRLGVLVWNDVQKIPVNVDMKILSDCLMFEKGHKQYEWHPLELSEKWLLNFGFVFSDYEVEDFEEDDLIIQCYELKKSENFNFEVHLISDGFNEFVIKSDAVELVLHHNLKYVHQLQNLYFALTGEELNY